MESGRFDVVLFDLGGVLVDIGGTAQIRSITNSKNDDDLWQRWLACPWVRSFESGSCSTDEFAAGFVTEWDLQIAPEMFIEAFSSWLAGPMDGASELVAAVKDVLTVGCLSNTNMLHWNSNFARWPVFRSFDHRYLSFELGLVKPDAELFERVARNLAVPRERVLFLDDNAANVEAGNAAGFVATQVIGVNQAHRELVARGVLSP